MYNFTIFRIVNGELGQIGQNVHKHVEQDKKHVQDQLQIQQNLVESSAKTRMGQSLKIVLFYHAL